MFPDAVQNIRTRVNRSKRGYAHERRENISDAAWDWVQSPDFATLQENRDRLLHLLCEADQTYLWEYWYLKESNDDLLHQKLSQSRLFLYSA